MEIAVVTSGTLEMCITLDELPPPSYLQSVFYRPDNLPVAEPIVLVH